MSVDKSDPAVVYLPDQDKSAKRLTRKEKLKLRSDKAERNQLLEARKTMINSEFWDKFLLVAKVCYMHDKDSDLYDVFETYRTKFMGGWESSPEQLSKLDAIIEKEEATYGFAGA